MAESFFRKDMLFSKETSYSYKLLIFRKKPQFTACLIELILIFRRNIYVVHHESVTHVRNSYILQNNTYRITILPPFDYKKGLKISY